MQIDVVFWFCVENFVANFKAQSADLINTDNLNISMCQVILSSHSLTRCYLYNSNLRECGV